MSTTSHHNTHANWDNLTELVNDAYTGIVNKVKNPFQNLHETEQDQATDKSTLAALREKHYQLIQQNADDSNKDYAKVTKQISEETKHYVQQIIEQELAKMGPAPCPFSFFTLGSMARQECGPVTDLEIGILMQEKTTENYKYFAELSQNISDRLFLLGEHPSIGGKGLRMDEADNAPPHLRFFARNESPRHLRNWMNEAVKNRDWDKIPFEGSRPYLTTPDEFIQFSRPEFSQNKRALAEKHQAALATARTEKQRFWTDQAFKPYNLRELKIANDAGKKLGRNFAFLYGDEQQFNQVVTGRNKIFNQINKDKMTHRQQLAKDTMSADINEMIQKGKSFFITGKLGKTLDIKRELYRFVEQFITNLGFYHHCQCQNSVDIVNELMARDVITADLGEKLIAFVQFATKLRLQQQTVLKRQGFATYLDAEKFEEDRQDLEADILHLTDSIAYYQSVSGNHQDKLDQMKRDLVKKQVSYEHLLDMAPGKVITDEDLAQLENHYLPIATEIFGFAKAWTQGQERLGVENKAAIPVPPPLPPATKPLLFSQPQPPQRSTLLEWLLGSSHCSDSVHQQNLVMPTQIGVSR